MDIGPYALPGLAIVMLLYLIIVGATWVNDGTAPEKDIDVLDEPEPPADPAGTRRLPPRR